MATIYMYCKVLILVVSGLCLVNCATPPHIVFIAADDLGWNDIGFRNPQMITPNIDKLAREGVILNSSYVQPVCSPTRNCFMTGYYPFHTGLQNGVIRPSEPHCVPLKYTFLPQKLKELGYTTRAIGKWHVGFCNVNCTPTYRGFDSFSGYYTGAEDYFNHTRGYQGEMGYDFRHDFERNSTVDAQDKGRYSAHVFADKAIEIIRTHDASKPLYLYLPFQSVHAPLQVPIEYENMYLNIHNLNRRTFCGMTSALDEAIGNITQALLDSGLMDNLLLVFTSDNGGPVENAANNLPLRGGKHTLWEGGTKGTGFIYSTSLLEKTGYIQTGMMHAVDWYPTLVTLAGGTPDTSMDGVSQWEMLRTGVAPSARTEFIYNIEQISNNSAIRMGDYKLIVGDAGKPDGWTPLPTDSNPAIPQCTDQYGYCTDDKLYYKSSNKIQLFNISSDPTEHFDISKQYPDIVAKLKARLDFYTASAVPPFHSTPDPKSNPKYFDGNWSPGWC
ncbi:arylsulfatase J [Patella vulgata]|uniref:arylsulfatase J n=1 Tax=Patella vulgata TaxID=6465 RepID=UPI002180302B|nr:arylsulfatase J [Patella vulgata]